MALRRQRLRRLQAPREAAAGWGSSYNVVVGIGDLTGDAKADITARDTSGTVWRYNGSGTPGTRMEIATGWQVHKGVF
ncbi:hypothetical protein OG930_18155 [Streptomyces sp. NBC_01799]|nr:hypothetical protein OG930_18155 [Streptomyces sp. NBC_01799]